MLVAAGDAYLPGCPVGRARRRLAEQPHVPAVRPGQAGEDRDERRLARSVPPDEGVALRGVDVERDVAERDRAAERFPDARGLADGRPGRPRPPGVRCGVVRQCFLLPQRFGSFTLAFVTSGAFSASSRFPLSRTMTLPWFVFWPTWYFTPASACLA